MGIIDKHNLLPDLANRQHVSLELGCGNRKRNHNFVGVDLLDYECVDLVGDVYEILRALPEGVVDEVYSSHFVEHVQDVPMLLTELARVLKTNAKLVIIVPHFSNPYFYSDIMHKAFFGLYSMSYFSNDAYLCRKVPTYQRELFFSLEGVRLGFKSAPPFYVRHAFKKIIGVIVNLNTYTKEMYEEMFCYLVPCYEIRYELRRVER
jgi:ubiquinone/menaquinone biosynthesis C-methylase UbiE